LGAPHAYSALDCAFTVCIVGCTSMNASALRHVRDGARLSVPAEVLEQDEWRARPARVAGNVLDAVAASD